MSLNCISGNRRYNNTPHPSQLHISCGTKYGRRSTGTSMFLFFLITTFLRVHLRQGSFRTRIDNSSTNWCSLVWSQKVSWPRDLTAHSAGESMKTSFPTLTLISSAWTLLTSPSASALSTLHCFIRSIVSRCAGRVHCDGDRMASWINLLKRLRDAPS